MLTALLAARIAFDTVVSVFPQAVTLAGPAARASLQAHCRDISSGFIPGVTWSWAVRNTGVVQLISSTKSAVTLQPVGDGTSYVVATCLGERDSSLITVTGFTGTAACDSVKTNLTHLAQFDPSDPWDQIHRNEADNATWSHSLETNLAFVAECSASVKFDLRVGDLEGTTPRVEFKLHADSGNGLIPLQSGESVGGGYGDEVWGGWSIYIPSNWVNSTNAETIAQAWSGCSNGRSPPWELRTSGANFTTLHGETLGPPREAGSIPMVKGTWNYFVWRIIWRDDATGTLQMWHASGANPPASQAGYTQWVNRTNVSTIWTDCHTITRFKFGIYKWSNWGTVTQRVLYYDALRFSIGASRFDAVRPK